MIKVLASLPLIAAALLAGCGNHLSTQEANVECQQERERKPDLTDDDFAECVACFEECGNTCEAQGTSPETYACPTE
jgi:hypothetical protein